MVCDEAVYVMQYVLPPSRWIPRLALNWWQAFRLKDAAVRIPAASKLAQQHPYGGFFRRCSCSLAAASRAVMSPSVPKADSAPGPLRKDNTGREAVVARNFGTLTACGKCWDTVCSYFGTRRVPWVYFRA